MKTKEKTIGQFDISIFENIGRYFITIENDENKISKSFIAKYEAEEMFNNLETEKDCKNLFLKQEK